MTKRKSKKSSLSTTSLVLSIVALVLCVSIIGLIIGIPIAIVGLVFGIIALVKKQKKSTALAGTIISGIIVLLTIVFGVIIAVFLNRNSEILIDPLKDFVNVIENDEELEELFENREFANEYEYIVTQRITAIFGTGEELEELDERDEVKLKIPEIYETMTDVALELKEKYKN